MRDIMHARFDPPEKESKMSFLLNSTSTLLCPHGARVQHIPLSATMYKVNGYPPMRVGDNYMVTGCPNMMPLGPTMMPSPCMKVHWTVGSPMMMVKGSPVLTSKSVGLCMSSAGVPQGPVIIASYQMLDREPTTLTRIDN